MRLQNWMLIGLQREAKEAKDKKEKEEREEREKKEVSLGWSF